MIDFFQCLCKFTKICHLEWEIFLIISEQTSYKYFFFLILYSSRYKSRDIEHFFIKKNYFSIQGPSTQLRKYTLCLRFRKNPRTFATTSETDRNGSQLLKLPNGLGRTLELFHWTCIKTNIDFSKHKNEMESLWNVLKYIAQSLEYHRSKN